jgi:hypothetical protein
MESPGFNDIIDEGFALTFPLYSYLLGVENPMPGYLGSVEQGIFKAPLWTDIDLFERFMADSRFDPSAVSALEIRSPRELIRHLESLPKEVTAVLIDHAVGSNIFTEFDRQKFISDLQGLEND